jgi:dihydropyrimidinase
MYLFLTGDAFDEPQGAKYLGHPPARSRGDRDALWHGLAAGDVHCVCSDHAPWLLRQKLAATLTLQPSASRSGVGELEAQFPLLYSEGVRRGRLSLSRFVELTSTNAAKLFGLYPRKGTIAVGSDADLVVWDPDARWTVDGAAMQSKSDYSVYDGWDVCGKPVVTVSRGDVVFEGGEVTAERGRGRWVRRDRTGTL